MDATIWSPYIYCDELHTHWTIYTTWIQILLVNLTEVCDLYVCVMFLCVLLFICLEWAVLFLYDTWSNSVHPSISGFLIHIILTTTTKKTKKIFSFNTLGRVSIVEDVLLMNMMLCVCVKLSYDGSAIGLLIKPWLLTLPYLTPHTYCLMKIKSERSNCKRTSEYDEHRFIEQRG